jgi:hypothetical protein
MAEHLGAAAGATGATGSVPAQKAGHRPAVLFIVNI